MKTLNDYAQMIDHTNLKADASVHDFAKLCQEARDYHFKMVAINSGPVSLCKELLKGSPVHIGAAISFPLGQTTLAVKVFETEDAIKNGADEIDYVINIRELKRGNMDYIEEEMRSIVELCRYHNVISKVILETCYLSDEEIVKVCEIAKEVKPDFVKTSTGFGPEGARVEDVFLMKSVVGDVIGVKASGGIRDKESFLAMIAAGATRIGTSSGLAIIASLAQDGLE